MNIELRKWSVEDKEVLIKMCNSIDRSFLSDRLPNPYTNASAEWWLTMVKDNEGKKGVFREIVVDGKIVGTISVEQKDDVYRKDSEIGYYLLQEVYSKGIMSEAVRQICEIAFETLDIIRITGLTLLMQIYSCAKEGAQFIIVTHSPILLGIPDADIYCFDDGRIHLCEYEETESYRVTEMFINNRQMLLDKLLTD